MTTTQSDLSPTTPRTTSGGVANTATITATHAMNKPFSFNLTLSARFAPRLGRLSFRWSGDTPEKNIETPSFMTTTSRGVVPHLSRDHHRATKAIQWVSVPFETFLEQTPPVPTMLTGKNCFHKFLGFVPGQHLLSLTVRDPSVGREMPPNGNKEISAFCLRGVRKVSSEKWRTYVAACQPDIVVAMYDQPFTNPPYSQKRLTKTIERTSAWLADLLPSLGSNIGNEHIPRPLVLVHMAGGANVWARKAFSTNLIETLFGKEADAIAPLKCLDQGVDGYIFDLVPLRQSLEADAVSHESVPNAIDHAHLELKTEPEANIKTSDQISPLLQASLASLPSSKLRVVNTAQTPHEILRLIRDVGVDMFDAHWVQKAADIGIALDFQFPIPSAGSSIRRNGKRDIGYNLFDIQYAMDFSSLGASFESGSRRCGCLACAPTTPESRIKHSDVDVMAREDDVIRIVKPSFTRAYIHHLLHTHEMSSHTLIVSHNLSVLDSFFAGIREVLQRDNGEQFRTEVDRFIDEYDEGQVLSDEARESWHDVEMARGKGRIAREKAKEATDTLIQ